EGMMLWPPLHHLSDAEKVLETFLANERIALHVKEEVGGRWRGQGLKPEVLTQWGENLVGQLAGLHPIDLKLGLLAQPGQGILINALNWFRWAVCQRRQSRDA